MNSEAIDAVLRAAVQQAKLPGVVAIVAGRDRILYQGAFGYRNAAQHSQMVIDSIFRIASMTKAVTCVCVMMLIEEGRLSPDEPVEKHLPEFANREVIDHYDEHSATYTTRKAARPITIRHLLTTTSGLAY